MLNTGNLDYSLRVRILSSFKLMKLQNIASWTALWANTLSNQSTLPCRYILDVGLRGAPGNSNPTRIRIQVTEDTNMV